MFSALSCGLQTFGEGLLFYCKMFDVPSTMYFLHCTKASGVIIVVHHVSFLELRAGSVAGVLAGFPPGQSTRLIMI